MRLLGLGLVVTLLPLPFCVQGRELESRDRLCGPTCLLLIMQKMGVQSTLEEIVSLSGTGKRGSSLAGLCMAAEKKGLNAVPFKLPASDLTDVKDAAICHLWTNHFVLVEAEDSGKLKVTDPPAEPRSVAVEDFAKAYSGFALLVSKDKALFPAPKDEDADLRVDGYNWEFQPVEEGEKLQHTFACRNAGSEELIISKIDSTCGCTAAVATEERIPPGGKGEITVAFDSAGRTGSQRQTVYIHSNDPITPVVQLQVTGVVRPARLLFSPDCVSFGEVRRGEAARREIFVPKSDVREVEIQKVSSHSPYFRTAVAQKPDKSGQVVTISLASNAPVGEIKSEIAILTNHPKDPKVEVPVTASVKGDVDVFPDTLFFGLLKQGAGTQKKLTITNSGDKPLVITDIENPLPNALVRAIPKVEGKEYTLVGTLLTNTPPGYIKGEIAVHTNNADQPVLKVPVYALVEE